MRIRSLFLNLSRFKNSFLLIMGNTLGKSISALGALYLANLYSPQEFGILSVYLSVFMIASCIITLQIENVTVFIENENDARVLVYFSIIACLGLSCSLGLLLFFTYKPLLITFLKLPQEFFLILILHLSFYGLHEFLTSWSLRCMKFKFISVSQIIFHFCLIGCQIIISYFWLNTAFGLVIGYLVGYALSSVFLYVKNKEVFNIKENFSFILKVSREQIKQNIDYIINATLPAIFDQIRIFMPILLLTKFFSTEVAGIFFLALKILNFPIMLFSTAFSKSMLQEYSKNFNNKVYLHTITKKYLPIISLLGFSIYFVLYLLGKTSLISLIGPQWGKITTVMPILCLGVCAEFISLPFLTIFPAIRKQNILAIWKFLFLIISFLGLYFATSFKNGPILFWTYSLINSFFYIIGILLNIGTEKSLEKH